MTEIEIKQAHDPIKRVHEGYCAALSGRSTLTYEVGKHEFEDTLHLRIVGNTGRGAWSKGWISGRRIDGTVANEDRLTGKRLHDLQHGQSRNTGGFVLAALIDLGLVRKRNAQFHEHVPQATFESVVTECLKRSNNELKTRHM